MQESNQFRQYLVRLCQELEGLEGACRLLDQAPRRERGAWVKLGLAGSASDLEKSLLKSYRHLAIDVLASLHGSSDDIVSGRLAQARDEEVTDGEIDSAMAYYDLPKGDGRASVDSSRRDAVLALILLWRRRQAAIADAAVQKLFDQGHSKAIEETGLRSQMPTDTIRAVRDRVSSLYDRDIDRLETGLRDGTKRARGIDWIVQHAASLGIAAALIRRLMTSEQFRIEMFAESLTWRAWSDGYRVGAVDATQTALKDAGVTVTADLSPADLDDETKAQIPAWVWSGPDDERCCDPCRNAFDEGPVYAFSLDDLPVPEDVCQFGRACRHWWSLEDS